MPASQVTAASHAPGGGGAQPLVVERCSRAADGVLTLRLSHPRGEMLPAWEAGAHIDLHLPSGLIRQYSLCGDLQDRRTYTIAILREPAGRGGSEEVHATQLVGRTLGIRGPRNRFPLIDADSYLFLAGGIGVTPIRAMIQQVIADHRPWTLHYGGRSLPSMAFAEELCELGAGRSEIVPQDRRGFLDLESILAGARPGCAVYCCGPPPMIEAARGVAARLGIGSFHSEQFASVPRVQDAAGATRDAGTFEVELSRTGTVVTVSPERSILATVREVLPDVESSCEDGFCGTCETRVIAGVPDHRDTVLTDEERAAGTSMMICVGRAKTPRLVLDL